ALANNGGWVPSDPALLVFDIIFYEDNAGLPGAVVSTFTGLSATYEDTGIQYAGVYEMYKWSVTLPDAVDMTGGWISIQSEIPSDSGNLMWATGPDGNLNAQQLQSGVLVPLGQNMAYDLGKADEYWPPHWPPGTYQVAGIVKNFGITYTENNFDVNAKITCPTGEVVYDHSVTIIDPLTPGSTSEVNFPEFTIPNDPSSEGNWKLTIKTMFPGDDHPNNDKKTLSYNIVIEPDIPPYTWAELSGTMGLNNWYASNVTITLYAYDDYYPPKWPSGVNHTYYKIDDADWNEYFAPFDVNEDGMHIVYFYSVDRDIPPNVEEEKYVEFNIDQTPPSISVSTEKIGFRLWKFTADASDETSGVVLVQFYIDNMLLGNTTDPGFYEWYWEGKGNHIVKGIAYDRAGNTAENDVTISLSLSQNQNQRFSFMSTIRTLIRLLFEHLPLTELLTKILTAPHESLLRS
ncbi:MAG TPA: hypothetical protein DSN98_07595, partial [Thermoplasmata archaeon]